MRASLVVGLVLSSVLASVPARAQNQSELARQVREAEQGFAASMARRDLAAFGTFLAEEAIFFGQGGATRGKAAVIDAWKGFFDGPDAPFSWSPETVEVLDSGTLALSSGPVLSPAGERIGTFNSIWRREADGRWRVLFDKGCPVCNCSRTP